MMMSSTISTRAPGAIVEAAPQLEHAVLALDEDRLGAEPARRLVARHDAAERRRGDDVDRPEFSRALAASARQSFSVRSGSWKTNIFCRKIGECRPELRMKWPSSSAPAARNSARVSSGVSWKEAAHAPVLMQNAAGVNPGTARVPPAFAAGRPRSQGSEIQRRVVDDLLHHEEVRVWRTPGKAMSCSPCRRLKSAMSRTRIFRK